MGLIKWIKEFFGSPERSKTLDGKFDYNTLLYSAFDKKTGTLYISNLVKNIVFESSTITMKTRGSAAILLSDPYQGSTSASAKPSAGYSGTGDHGNNGPGLSGQSGSNKQLLLDNAQSKGATKKKKYYYNNKSKKTTPKQ